MNIFKKLKNKTQDYIKRIKTMFYAKLAVSLKKRKLKKKSKFFLFKFVQHWINRKLKKIIFMLTYNKYINTFNFQILIDDRIIAEYNGRCVYGQNKTTYDSFIEVEFIPHPIITQTSLIIPNKFQPITKNNIGNNINEQILELLDDFIVNIGGGDINYSINERRKSFNVFFSVDSNFIETTLIYDKINNELKKTIIIQPNQEIVEFSGDVDDDEIISKVYDIIKPNR